VIEKVPVVLDVERTLDVTFTSWHELAGRHALVAHIDQTRQDELIDAIEPRCVDWDDAGHTVFVGALGHGPHGVFALPVVDPTELMAAFAVGSHHDLSPRGDTAARARLAMQQILRDAPFVPYFIDAAGMKVRFVDPVPPLLAQRIEVAVLDFDLEALDLIDDDGREPPSLASSIHRTQRLQLWWD